jgi:chemotaxis protein CheX
MSNDKGFNDLLNSTVESVSQVIPFPTEIRPTNVLESSVIQNEMGVLVGITGDIKC